MKKKSFIGIDISKKTLDVVIFEKESKNQKDIKYLKVSNDTDGYKEMIKWIKSFNIKLGQTVIGMENTGMYGYDLRLYLEKENIDYTVYNPLDLKRSMGLVRGKNDKVDASRIAYFTWLHRDELRYHKLSNSTIMKLRDLAAERKRFIHQCAKYKQIMTDNKGRSRTSTLDRTQAMITILEENIEAVEKEIEDVIAEDEKLLNNYRLLISIKGIGSVNAISTILHTNNFAAFEDARQYACYLGIAPFEHQSGTSVRGRTKVSHYGAIGLKADLTQAAQSAMVHDMEIKTYYERKRKEGKPFGVVLNAIKFKLVCRMFAVVRRGQPFVDLYNYRAK